jgi:hypothetical protein
MQIQNSASKHSVQDLLTIVADSFDAGGAVLLNLIEAIAIGPSPGSPVEVSDRRAGRVRRNLCSAKLTISRSCFP